VVLACGLGSADASQPSPRYLNADAQDDAAGDLYQRIETDGNGHWVAVWQRTVNGENDIAVATSAGGAGWTPPRFLNSNALTEPDHIRNGCPVIATDGVGHWVVAWVSWGDYGLGPDWDIWFARSSDNGLTWSDQQMLNATGSIDGYYDTDHRVQLIYDGGTWVAVWESSYSLGDSTQDGDVFISRSTDNGVTWSYPAHVNSNAANAAEFDGYPDVAADGNGLLLVTWFTSEIYGVNARQSVSRSIDGGVTWSAPTTMPGPLTDQGNTKIFSDGSGKWLAVWTSGYQVHPFNPDNELYASVSQDAGITWTPSAVVNNDAASDSITEGSFDALADSHGWLVVWSKNFASSGQLRLARSSDGQNWVDLPSPTPGFEFLIDHYGPDMEVDESGEDILAWATVDAGVQQPEQDLLYIRCSYALGVDCDGDSVGDQLDLCPDTAGGQPVDGSGCSDQDVDPDGDGFCDPGAPSAGPSICSGSDVCPQSAGNADPEGCPPPGPPSAVGGFAGLIDESRSPSSQSARGQLSSSHAIAALTLFGLAVPTYLFARRWLLHRQPD
jgi:hypothetical protein